MQRSRFILIATIFLMSSFFESNLIFGQGEANFWYFGVNAGLDFNGGAPVPVTNGQMNQLEGCSSISNTAGNLLFYTDGIQVWNSSHVQMPNGFGLTGHNSATQSALIVQKPGSSTVYYIFTVTASGLPNGLRYSEVDMTLNAGLGDVTANKNILLNTPTCEKITGIRHCNNQDVWVVSHDWNSNAFRTYLVTAAGVNPVAVITNIGVVASSAFFNNSFGQLKGSPDGKKIAYAKSFQSIFELFDFNNSTGTLSNAILLSSFLPACCAYGVEFSLDATKLYGSDGSSGSPYNVYQFDLCAGSNAAIANSGILIATSSSTAGSLQLGPDQKIYLARAGDSWLGVINNPNTLGVGCNYVNNGVSLAGKVNAYGLPNFPSYYFRSPLPPFTASINCLTGTFAVPTVNLSNCSGSSTAITSASWNFGDPSSGGNNTSASNNPTHNFTSAGTYSVTLVLNYACGSDTLRQTVTAVNCGFTATATPNNIPCNGQCTGIGTATPTGGTGPYTYTWSNGQTTSAITGLCAGTYSVLVTDASSATATAIVSITAPAILTSTISATNSNCIGAAASGTVTAGGGTSAYTYLWSPSGGTSSTATGLSSGNYTATITDANGCTKTETVTITQSPAITVTVTTNTATCLSSNGDATAAPSGGTPGYSYTWSNGQTTQTATGLAAGTYTITITDASGCTQTSLANVSNGGSPQANISSTTNILCNGGSNGSASVNVTVGIAPYTYSWNPSSQTTTTATGLSAGNYVVTVRDALGCIVIVSTTITQPTAITASVSSTSTGCTGPTGTATVAPVGGSGSYSYLWSNGQTTSVAAALGSGSYTVTIKDANGCTQTQTVNVTQTPGPTVTASASINTIPAGGSSVLTATGGGTYQWSPTNDLSNANTANPIATPSQTTTYCVVVTDGNGCQDSTCVTITMDLPCGQIYIPNAFSPNNDLENDFECVFGSCIETFHLAIYNRWGEKVFESTDQKFCWDGTYKGKTLNTAVFDYYLDATLNSGEKISKKGNVTLVR